MSPGIPIIHVIDDDASFRTGVARLLRASGYDVALYDTAAQFLDNQPGDRPGCILLDVRMPELSGPEAQARLIEAGNPLPIIFLTGHGDLPTSVRAIKQGAEDFLSKPAPGKVLVEAIERALARYEESRERQLRLRAPNKTVARSGRRSKRRRGQERPGGCLHAVRSGSPAVGSERSRTASAQQPSDAVPAARGSRYSDGQFWP